MTEANTQAVVEDTNVEATPSTTVDNAQGNDLAAFLTEYETGTKPTPVTQQQPSTPPDEVKAALSEITAFRNERAAEKHNTDLAKAVQTVKGDHDLPEWAVQGWIDAKARENKVIADIWANRDSNPGAVNKLLNGMKKEFAAEQAKTAKGRVDPDATADRAAVAAAVRGSSTATPTSAPVKLGNLSNSEFNQLVREQMGFSPGV